jgi:hypothetical protein
VDIVRDEDHPIVIFSSISEFADQRREMLDVVGNEYSVFDSSDDEQSAVSGACQAVV